MKRAVFIALVLFIIIQFIRPSQTNPKVSEDLMITLTPTIEHIFKVSCYDCHSNNTKWPWYSKIAPMSWVINEHVKEGRKGLNFSIWETYDEKTKKKKLKKIYKKVYSSMPLTSYTLIHKDAKLTKKQIKLIRDWTKGVKK